MKKKILITGGAGFIGSNFVRRLYERYPDYHLLVLDALTYAGSVRNLPVDIKDPNQDRLTFWYGNVINGELVDTLVSRAQVVVHFAAETHVTRSIFDNFQFFQTDVLGTQAVANAVLKHHKTVERFIHISTSEVYGTASTPLMDEEHPLHPTSPYASAKAGADLLVQSYHATYNIPSIIMRPFNNFGPYQHLEKVIPRFITSCILGEPLSVHGQGEASRDFVFVEDMCRAVDLAMHADLEAVRGQIFNLASGQHRSILSIAQEVVELMGASPEMISYVGDRPGQVFRHTGDAARIKKVLGWEPRHSWRQGLERTIAWYRENRPWWERLLWMRSVPIMTANGKIEMH